jgi:hypothetical protein
MNIIRTIEGSTLVSIGVLCIAAIVNILFATGTPSEHVNVTTATTSQQSAVATAKRSMSAEKFVLVKQEKRVATDVL